MADETNSTAPRRDAVPDAPGGMTADRLRSIADALAYSDWPAMAKQLRAHADELEAREKAGVDAPVEGNAVEIAKKLGMWRVGSQVPINVYDGERPVCQCHTAEDARRIVSAINTIKATEYSK